MKNLSVSNKMDIGVGWSLKFSSWYGSESNAKNSRCKVHTSNERIKFLPILEHQGTLAQTTYYKLQPTKSWRKFEYNRYLVESKPRIFKNIQSYFLFHATKRWSIRIQFLKFSESELISFAFLWFSRVNFEKFVISEEYRKFWAK